MARPIWEWPDAALQRFRGRPPIGKPESLPQAILYTWAYILAAFVLASISIVALHLLGLWDPYSKVVMDVFWLIPGGGFGLGLAAGEALPWVIPFLLAFKMLSRKGDDD